MIEQDILQEYKTQLEGLGKGGKTDLINKLAKVLDCSPRTAQRKLKAIGYQNAKRKERSDKGTSSHLISFFSTSAIVYPIINLFE